MKAFSIAGPLTVLAVAQLHAQGTPTYVLRAIDAELPNTFRQITDVRELSGGQLIVADAVARFVYVVDFSKRTRTQIGRQGFGNDEYLWPDRLLALPADTTLIHDAIEGRLHIVPWDSTLLAAPLRGLSRLDLESPSGSRFHAQFVDGAGRFYRDLRAAGARAVDQGSSERPALERLTRNAKRIDTLVPPNLTATKQTSSYGAQPFPIYDRWAISSDGSVARVHVEPYGVVLISPEGVVRTNRVLPLNRIPVTAVTKKAWREFRKRPRVLYTSLGRGQYGFVEDSQPFREPATWPEYLPAVLGSGARFAPDRTLWVERNTLAGTPPEYDVIDLRGPLIKKVHLEDGSRVVGFGNRTVYVARSDGAGHEYLRRYRYPE